MAVSRIREVDCSPARPLRLLCTKIPPTFQLPTRGTRIRGNCLARHDVHGENRCSFSVAARPSLPRNGAGLSVAPISDLTRILSAIEHGDPKAAAQLLP